MHQIISNLQLQAAHVLIKVKVSAFSLISSVKVWMMDLSQELFAFLVWLAKKRISSNQTLAAKMIYITLANNVNSLVHDSIMMLIVTTHPNMCSFILIF